MKQNNKSKLFEKLKQSYLLVLIVVGLIGLSLYSTYSMFTASTELNNVVNMTAGALSLSVDELVEYQQMTLTSGESRFVEINVSNSTAGTLYYGIWYQMITPSVINDNIIIAMLDTSTNNTTGTLASGNSKTVILALLNNSSDEITFNIGVGSSPTSSLGLPTNRIVITDTYYTPDLKIDSIKINNVASSGIPTTGFYSLTSECSNLTWDPVRKKLKFTDFTGKTTCNLSYTTSTNYPLLNTMQVGDYVAYVGNNGCMNNGTDVTGTSDAESKNSCLGWNANQTDTTDQDDYGYCSSTSYKYYVYGWRIAYIDSGKVYLTTAGSPECRTRTSSTGNATQIADLNNAALDYCNSTYTGGTCSASTAWAMGNEDYKKMTLAISGTSSNLTSAYGSPYCYAILSTQSCGYNNSLIDNGGYYWFAAYYTTSSTYGVAWRPYDRYVGSSSTNAYGFRPIISLVSTVYVTGGSGTMEDPYTIGI